MKTHVHIWACPGLHAKEPKDPYWICLDKACMARLKKRSLQGKVTLCTKCFTETVLDPDNLKRAYPRCPTCLETKQAKEKRKLHEAAGSIFDELLIKE